jgi:hypothetical protein
VPGPADAVPLRRRFIAAATKQGGDGVGPQVSKNYTIPLRLLQEAAAQHKLSTKPSILRFKVKWRWTAQQRITDLVDILRLDDR